MIVTSAILKDGIVYIGKRHPDILCTSDNYGKLKDGIQGFVTDKGEFLDRKLARAHFIESGQIPIHGKLHPTLLFSEDLY